MTENRLAGETSPYLLQHKDNPVHWWPWGEAALEEAKRSGKPILLSVGYAACHWCHVMAHESFEDDETAAVMNELFVNIKVDREERPDVDAIYMGALHRLGEQGGWPLTMFLDSDARPFFGGTYFPKQSRWGKPAFVSVLQQISRIFRDEPEKVAHNAEAITEMLRARKAAARDFALTEDLLEDLTRRMAAAIDREHGGITGAPKFPQWSFFWLLWRGAIRYGQPEGVAAVERTLANICQGGIYDHLGGGFARYSVDERWLAPHFEKMLYDNALLIDLMTEVWRETRNPLFPVRIAETVAWLEREMVAEGGAFAASLDADSEGEEGKFYVWTAGEIAEVLGAEDARFFGEVYDVAPEGNWEGRTILNRLADLKLRGETDEQRLAALRGKLLAHRAGRIRPGWDDKVLADWNGLMIAALARAAQVFGRPEWLALAERAFAFVDTRMSAEGRLWHSWRKGSARAPATASDYSDMTWGALRLYQATGAARYLDAARRWTEVLDRHYWAEDAGGYAMTADDTRDLIVRIRSAHDDATPNANAVMVANLVALAQLTGEAAYQDRAEAVIDAFAADLRGNPIGHTGLLANALDLFVPQQAVVVGRKLAGGKSLEAALYGISLPGALQFVLEAETVPSGSPALAGKAAMDGKATAYVCLGPQCSQPITEAEELTSRLKSERTWAEASPPP